MNKLSEISLADLIALINYKHFVTSTNVEKEDEEIYELLLKETSNKQLKKELQRRISLIDFNH